jgi:hypothetical protein
MIIMDTLRDLVKTGSFEEIRNMFLLMMFSSLIGGICIGLTFCDVIL